MTSYYEDKIKELKKRVEENKKKKEELQKALKLIGEDEEFFRRQISDIEKILEKEKELSKKRNKRQLVQKQ